MKPLAYDRTYEPAAPVAPILLGSPDSERRVLVPALVDTGADCCVVAMAVARGLRLPAVGRTAVQGVTGPSRMAWVYAARVDLAGVSMLARFVALGSETILGRDVLERLVVRLDGPRQLLTLTRSKR